MRLRRRIRIALKGLRHPQDIARHYYNNRLRRLDAARLADSVGEGGLNPQSVLFITLDSCRYDTWVNAHCPHLKSIGEWYEASAPATFTLASHAAMFVGMTPGIPGSREPYRNPKAGRIFRLLNAASGGVRTDWVQVHGANIIDGFNRLGYRTIGTGAVRWFDPELETGVILTKNFKVYRYMGRDVEAQVAFVLSELDKAPGARDFVFMNIGETHVPYHHRGAPWPPVNPCMPLGKNNSRELSQERQRKCLEFVDEKLAPLIRLFKDAGASIIVCADHGDCHGEDGLWGHGFVHEKVMKVPMVYSLRRRDEAGRDLGNEGVGVPTEALAQVESEMELEVDEAEAPVVTTVRPPAAEGAENAAANGPVTRD